MPRQRHFVNVVQPGETGFFTTTALDWAPVFSRTEMAQSMVQLLFEVHNFHGSQLHGFVVMPDHVHFISKLSSKISGAEFLNRFKSYTGTQLRPRLNDRESKALATRAGLNRRVFWERGYRSFVIETEEVFAQKLIYIHENPGRRGLCKRDIDYKWSSAATFQAGYYNDARGLGLSDWLAVTFGGGM